MNTEVTLKRLEDLKACSSAKDWFKSQGKKKIDLFEGFKYLMSKRGIENIRMTYNDDSLSWSSWFITRIMNKRRRVMYVIYAAEQVIDIYEERYPGDRRPREAINAAKEYLKNPCKRTKVAAATAADAAYAAYAAADVVYAAAAAFAAFVAASSVAFAAASSVAFAVDAAEKEKMKKRILKYGIKILK
jgi:hypothetical protein